VIEQAASYTQFQDGYVGEVDSAAYTLRFAQLRGDCKLDEDGTLSMSMSMRFVAIPGVAMSERQVIEAPWFIVVLDQAAPETKLLAWRVFTQRIKLSRDGERQLLSEDYTVSVAGVTEAKLDDIAILAGYVLNDVQWQFHEDNPFLFR
jgi:hypothetical protein